MILSRIAAAGMAKIKLFLHLLERFLSVHEEQHKQAGEGGTVSGAGGAFNLTRSWHPQLSTGVMLLAELSAACAVCTCCTASSSVAVEKPASPVAVTCALC